MEKKGSEIYGDSNSTLSETVICYSGRINTSNGLWQGDNPLAPVFSIFPSQVVVIIVLVRVLQIALNPFKIPLLVPEILGGLLIGPNILGEWYYFRTSIFPAGSLFVFETLANLGVLYFSFLLGLEFNLKTMLWPGAKALHVALVGIILPFVTGITIFFILSTQLEKLGGIVGPFFCGAALSVTSFPVLTQVLADLKLLHGDIGQMAMSSAILNDLSSWVLLVLGTAASNPLMKMVEVLVCTIVFAMFCYFSVGPVISWLIEGTPDRQSLTKFQMCTVLIGVVVVAFACDVIGAHSLVGAFLYGISIRDGMIRSVLIEKLEDVVSGLLVPLFYGVSGLKTNLSAAVLKPTTISKLMVCIGLACMPKVVGTVIIGFFHKMPIQDGMALGVLMNTKGLMAVFLLDVAREKMVINDLIFISMLVAIILMTALTTPTLAVVYKTKRHVLQYVHRMIEGLGLETELRILACIYSAHNIPGITNLLQILNPTPNSPIYIFALHLVELTGRASAMLVVHRAHRTHGHNRIEAESDQIEDAFEKLEQDNDAISVQPLTAMSSYNTMHEDISSYAEDKRVALLILPFHQQQKINGSLEEDNPAIRGVNRNVLGEATCSVGIFLDRGLVVVSGNATRIAMLFFGGPDDREALAYAWRMLGHSGTRLTVVRFVLGSDAAQVDHLDIPDQMHGILSMLAYNECQKQLDDQLMNEFRVQTTDNVMVEYVEVVSNSGEESIAAIKAMDHDYDLYIVGKGDKVITPLTAGLSNWTDYPELGPIGDLLVSTDCAINVSVLVVQQYLRADLARDGLGVAELEVQTVGNYSNSSRPSVGASKRELGSNSNQVDWIA